MLSECIAYAYGLLVLFGGLFWIATGMIHQHWNEVLMGSVFTACGVVIVKDRVP